MTNHHFFLDNIDASWQECVARGLAQMDASYLKHLSQSTNWLPGPKKIFNAFSLPLEKVNYVLFGESPYPRAASANGFAFWDEAVTDIWSSSGLSKKVNRATSLRNIIKMLLVAEGSLDPKHSTQEAIAQIDKSPYIQSNSELFNNLLQHGFLLLNATLVLQPQSPQKDAKTWYPFVTELLACLFEKNPSVKFILLGKIAQTIDKLCPIPKEKKLYAEHPYNLTFITNPDILDFFKPFHLLRGPQKDPPQD